MVAIKTTCPTCGDVSLTSNDIELRVFPDSAQEDFYAFDCPDCSRRVRKHADDRVIRLLRTGGVEPVEAALHPERSAPNLPSIAPDELLVFHEQLKGIDCLVADMMQEG